MIYSDVLKSAPGNLRCRRTKVCSAGSMLISQPPSSLTRWTEMVLIRRASRSSSHEHQVMTIVPLFLFIYYLFLSASSSAFSGGWIPFSAALSLCASTKPGVSASTLSAYMSSAMSKPFKKYMISNILCPVLVYWNPAPSGCLNWAICNDGKLKTTPGVEIKCCCRKT